MSLEYLLVVFPDERAVLADGDKVGFTNHTLMLPANEYEIALDGGGTTYFAGLRLSVSAALLMSSINLVMRVALLPRSLSK